MGFGQSAFAQSPLENRITIMQASADEMILDLEYMIKDVAKQGKTWREYIEPNLEIFLDGVNTKKPVRVDIYFDEKIGQYYRMSFPYTDLKDFRNNIEASGITSKIKAKDLYQLSDSYDGWMKTVSEYAVFAPDTKKDLVAGKVANPLDDLKPLIAAGYDTSVLINNDKQGAEQRKASLDYILKNLLSGIKKKSTESLAEFELRKLVAEDQLVEFQTFYVESKYLEAGWITDREKNEGRGTLILSALEGTELDGALKHIANAKNRFVNIPESKDFVISGRLSFPIVKSRQQRYEALYKATLPVLLAKIEKNKDLSASQIKATHAATEKTIAMLIKGLGLGEINGFVEMRPSKQDGPQPSYELIAAVNTTEGHKAKEIIELLPSINDSIQVKMNVESVGDLQLHEIVFNKSLLPLSDSMFGIPCKVYFATSDDMLAISIGNDAKSWLVETLELINKSEEKPVIEFVKFKAYAKPFAAALKLYKPSKDLKEPIKTVFEKFIETFDDKKYDGADDYFEMIDKVVNDKVQGTLKVEPGFFRFLGLLIADFAQNNL